MSDRYLEDFVVGQVFKPSGRARVEKDEIIAFAKQYDPQPFHLDEEAGRKSIFGRLVASGWHTAALTMRLVAQQRVSGGGPAPSASASMVCAGPFQSCPATNFAALSGWTSEQKHVVAASFLGWTLDAFDFFLMVFVLKDIAQEFDTDITKSRSPSC
jgi:hypothetical protein